MAVPVRMIAARRGRFVLSRSFGKLGSLAVILWVLDGIRVRGRLIAGMHGELRSVAVVGVVPALPSIVAVIIEELSPGVRLAVQKNPTRFGEIFGGPRSAGYKHGAPAVEEEGTRKNV